MKVLIVDNYDSFTYNLYHYVEMCEVDCIVKRNDEINLDEVSRYDKVILSPGPGLPKETLMMYDILSNYTKPILGVCLGMQGIAEFYGATLENQPKVKHGVKTSIHIDPYSKLYINVPSVFQVGLYHSWRVKEDSVPLNLKITGRSIEHVVLSIEHVSLPVYGVQYHPESVLSEHGLTILKNFIDFC